MVINRAYGGYTSRTLCGFVNEAVHTKSSVMARKLADSVFSRPGRRSQTAKDHGACVACSPSHRRPAASYVCRYLEEYSAALASIFDRVCDSLHRRRSTLLALAPYTFQSTTGRADGWRRDDLQTLTPVIPTTRGCVSFYEAATKLFFALHDRTDRPCVLRAP